MARDAEVAAAWREAASRLMAALQASSEPELQAAVLRNLMRRLGGVGFPGFLKMVLVVAESDDAQAKRSLARLFGACLLRADLPSGDLTSWGASTFWSGDEPIRAHELRASGAGVAPRRRFGPIEYLTVWYCQRTQRTLLSGDTYREALTRLVELFNHDADARRLYPIKIENEIATGLDGAYTRQVTQRLEGLAFAWRSGKEPEAVVAAALAGEAGAATARMAWGQPTNP